MSPSPADPRLKGFLESPGERHDGAQPLVISGWVFNPGSPIRSLNLVFNGSAPQPIIYGLSRPDVARLHHEPLAAVSGFQWQLSVEPWTDLRELDIRIIAALEDDTSVTCFARTVRLPRSSRERLVYRFLRSAVRKAVTALREGRPPVSPRWWFEALRHHWHETASRTADQGPQPLDRTRLEESYGRWLRSRTQLDAVRPTGVPPEIGKAHAPLLSIVCLIDDPSAPTGIVRSVEAQTVTAWELWLIGMCDRWAHGDARITSPCNDSRLHALPVEPLLRSDGTWLPPGSSEYVVLLDSGTLLAPAALSHILAATRDSNADWMYTDDDRLDRSGARCDPYLKGGFSPELAIADDYATRVAIVRRAAIEAAGGLRTEYAEAQIHDLLLRIFERGGRVCHLPNVCCHRRERQPAALGPRHRLAAEHSLSRRGVPAKLHVGRRDSPLAIELTRVEWPHGLLESLPVTIVVPTRDRVDLLQSCVEGLKKTVDQGRATLLIVDDESQDDATLAYLERLQQEFTCSCRVIRPPRRGRQFNYARMINAAAREVETPLMLQLNNDVEAISFGWLDQMAGWLALDDVGVVGGKLLYPDRSIQHAGVVVLPSYGTPEHLFCRLVADDPGYQWLPHRTRNVSAVTGACLLTRTELYRALGGFDEENLAVQFNDTDYCLRVQAAGKRVVYEPAAVLYHHTSASRGGAYDYRENHFFLTKYRDHRDAFHSPHLDGPSLWGPTPVVCTPPAVHPD